MNSFKFFKGVEETTIFLSNNINTRITNNEYCFQFDDEEPVVFGSGFNDLTMTITPTTGGIITFTQGDRNFKIFARERQ